MLLLMVGCEPAVLEAPTGGRSGQLLLEAPRSSVTPGDTLRILGSLSTQEDDLSAMASAFNWSCSGGRLLEDRDGNGLEMGWIAPAEEGEYSIIVQGAIEHHILGDTLRVWVLEYARPYLVVAVSNSSFSETMSARYTIKLYGSPAGELSELFIGGESISLDRQSIYRLPGLCSYTIAHTPLLAGDTVEVACGTELGTASGWCLFPDSLDGMSHILTWDQATGEHTLRITFPEERADQQEISLYYRYYVDGVQYSEQFELLTDSSQWEYNFGELPVETHRVTVYISPVNGVYSGGPEQDNMSGDFSGRLLAYGPRTMLEYNLIELPQGDLWSHDERGARP